MIKYIYPKLPAKTDLSFFRISGSGLANCMFVYAKAISLSRRLNCKLITPTWFNVSIGPYLRKQPDKRHYWGLFNSRNEISGVDKMMKRIFCKSSICEVDSMGNYFEEFIDDADYVSDYIKAHIVPSQLSQLNEYDFENCVAIHVRLGDYPENVRVPLEWYVNKIKEYGKNGEFRYLLFSDGSDDELSELMSMPNVNRAYFGSAIADILAISKCCYMIGSDSTFSGWGAFLGQVPCVFFRKHYGRILVDQSKEIVENNDNLWL